MNITFFIGNGFDLNLGLKTRYADFYPYFIEHVSAKNMIKTWLEEDKKALSSSDTVDTSPGKDWHLKLWSDLEEELGRKLDKVSEQNIADFRESKFELDDLLLEYLEQEQKRVITDGHEEEVAAEMKKSLMEFDRGMSQEDCLSIKATFDAHRSETHQYCFICFNYTDTLDRVVDLTRKAKPPFITHKNGGTGINDKLGTVLHIHGTMDAEMILGVNDEGQINNSELVKDETFLDTFIKRRMNSGIGQRKTETAKSLIDGSHIVGVFGMSLGSTDKMWWEELIAWLRANEKNKLIIYYKGYERELRRRNPGRMIILKNSLKETLLNTAGVDKDNPSFAKLKERILISFNTTIFTFKDITAPF